MLLLILGSLLSALWEGWLPLPNQEWCRYRSELLGTKLHRHQMVRSQHSIGNTAFVLQVSMKTDLKNFFLNRQILFISITQSLSLNFYPALSCSYSSKKSLFVSTLCHKALCRLGTINRTLQFQISCIKGKGFKGFWFWIAGIHWSIYRFWEDFVSLCSILLGRSWFLDGVLIRNCEDILLKHQYLSHNNLIFKLQWSFCHIHTG